MRKMKKTLSAATAVILATSLFAAGCGTQEAEQGGQTGTSAEAETTAASDLNSKTLDAGFLGKLGADVAGTG